MELRQLRYFLAVVASGSFSRAAVALHMTQPPLSIAISNLEKELGVQLLTRGRHGVRPTPAGEHLEKLGTKILADVDEMARLLRGVADGSRGRLSIAAEPIATVSVIPALLSRFTSEAPDVDIVLMESHPHEVLEHVANRRADVGLIPTAGVAKLRELHGERLEISRWGRMPLLAVLPPRYREHPDPIDLHDLTAEHWILPIRHPRLPGIQGIMEGVWDELGLPYPDYREVSTLQTAVPLISAGLGVTVMPPYVRQVAPPDIVVRAVLQPIPPLEGAIVQRREDDPPQTVRRFLSLARSVTDDV
jgi:DNA-binding transcriptional LysR family regulator